jgi:hypothetical protein
MLMMDESEKEVKVTPSKKDRIQVAIRVRPFLNKEYRDNEVVFCNEKDGSVKVSDLTHVVESKYDKIFSQNSTQEQLLGFIQGGLIDLLRGINCTVFAYGQTGSGKTHTMFGPKWEESVANQLMGNYKNDFFSNTENHGLIPRTITDLFNTIDMSTHTLYCSFIQIYNEKLYDLLQDPDIEHPLVIREDKIAGMFVEGLTEYVVEKDRD